MVTIDRAYFKEQMRELRNSLDGDEGYNIFGEERDDEIYEKIEPFLSEYKKMVYFFPSENGISMQFENYGFVQIHQDEEVAKAYFLLGEMHIRISFPIRERDYCKKVVNLIDDMEKLE